MQFIPTLSPISDPTLYTGQPYAGRLYAGLAYAGRLYTGLAYAGRLYTGLASMVTLQGTCHTWQETGQLATFNN